MKQKPMAPPLARAGLPAAFPLGLPAFSPLLAEERGIPTFVWLTGGVFLLVALVLSVLFQRHRRNTWRDFAQRHGLEYRDDPELGPEVRGVVDGRRFHLLRLARSSDAGAMGAEAVRMSLALSGELPPRLHVVDARGLAGALHKAQEHELVDTADPELEKKAGVGGEDAAQVLAYLTDERKQAIERLMDESGGAVASVEEGEVRIEEREMWSELDSLDHLFETLRRAAATLDPDPRPSGAGGAQGGSSSSS